MEKSDLFPPNEHSPDGHSAKPRTTELRSAQAFGLALKTLRLERGKSLSSVAAACSVSAATLSRIENGRLSPTFDVISKICEGLGIGLRQLLGDSDRSAHQGWSTLTRAGAGRAITTPQFRFELLCDEALAKPFLVLRAEVLCRTLAEFGPLQSHAGQEQIVVQTGRIEVWVGGYKPRVLEVGDSIAFDSRLGHAVVSVGGEAPATVLWICDAQEAGR